jgi:BASS family bile acid:Na+ symporter
MGVAAIRRHRLTIDGINILVLLVFVSAVMGHVAGSLFSDPLLMIELTLITFAVFLLLTGISALVFRAAGAERALAVGLMVSQRNMGLMVAATDGLLPGMTWLYFALSQFPIYLSPLLLKPIAQRLTAPKAVPAVPEAVDA